MARISGIQQALERQPFRSLYCLEANLKKKLDEVLSQEELLWCQKSRRDWINYGDPNTSFFHQKTITKRLVIETLLLRMMEVLGFIIHKILNLMSYYSSLLYINLIKIPTVCIICTGVFLKLISFAWQILLLQLIIRKFTKLFFI